MPWYKTGTVSVTQNSNAVIGTGTAFIANSRVGDAFHGPDGRWYEVINVASDTAMAISPNYQGASNAAGVYALAPMQGYVKDSADALRALVNTYGAKIAALGTTGNYEILPVDKGGTGGDTPAEARAGLELGTSATLDVTTTSSDSTAGRLMKVGDFGIGAAGPLLAPNSAIKNGMYTFAAGAAGAPLELASAGGSLIVNTLGGNYIQQLAMSVPGSTSNPYFGMRHFDSAGTPGPWRKFFHNANILGTVSQVSGIPTGAVIESGSNSNGTYIKWADGTMVCIRNIVCTAASLSVIAAPVHGVGPFFGQTAMTFSSVPSYTQQIQYCTGQLGWYAHGASQGSVSQGPNFWIYGLSSAGITAHVSQIAWGRWFG
ncbi:phage tail protein [Pseudomonas sp. R1-15]|uniref:phage tail protein n=1 Tax=Pseudomonas sp. R1-15 TaxID=2817399 RepID=UPI003DA7BEED